MKTIIITGATKGIGLESARLLLENQFAVVSWSRSKPDIEHPNFHHFPCDVRHLSEVESAWNQTLAIPELPVIYGLLNNAGLGWFGPVESLDLEKWQEMFDVNVHGLMYCTRQVVPHLKQNKAGHIINIASIASLDGVVQGSGYSATKFAVRGISSSLYKELREDGIKVSCVYPGSVKTNFFDRVDSITAHDNMMKGTDVADMILWLLNTSPNFLPVDIEIRPLKPRG